MPESGTGNGVFNIGGKIRNGARIVGFKVVFVAGIGGGTSIDK